MNALTNNYGTNDYTAEKENYARNNIDLCYIVICSLVYYERLRRYIKVLLQAVTEQIWSTDGNIAQEDLVFNHISDDVTLVSVLRLSFVLCTFWLVVFRHGRNVSRNACLNFRPLTKYTINSKALLEL